MFASQQSSSLNGIDNIETEFSLYFSSFQKWVLLCCYLCSLYLSHRLGLGRRGVAWDLSKYPQDDKVISERKFYFDWLWLFSVCHGSLLPYRRTNYLGQTIQCSLETIGFYGHNLILYISIFLKLWKSSQLFFSKQCSFSRLMEKTDWIEFFFQFQLLREKS